MGKVTTQSKEKTWFLKKKKTTVFGQLDIPFLMKKKNGSTEWVPHCTILMS